MPIREKGRENEKKRLLERTRVLRDLRKSRELFVSSVRREGHTAPDCKRENVNKQIDSPYPVVITEQTDIVAAVMDSGLEVIKSWVRINGRRVKATIDSACKYTLLSSETLSKLGANLGKKLEAVKLNLVGAENSTLRVLGKLVLPVQIDNALHYLEEDRVERVNSIRDVVSLIDSTKVNTVSERLSDGLYALTFIVVENLAVDCIIGTSSWPTLGVVINAKDNYLEIAGKRQKLKLTWIRSSIGIQLKPNEVCWVECKTTAKGPLYVETTIVEPDCIVLPGKVVPNDEGKFNVLMWNLNKDKVLKIKSDECVITADQDCEEILEDEHFKLENLKIGKHIKHKQAQKVKKLILKYRNRFREFTLPNERYAGKPVKLNLKKDAVAQQAKIIPRKPDEHIRIEAETQKLLDRDLIEKCEGPWRANTLLLKKKDGTTRFAIDYRLLNSQTDIIAFPMPLIQEILANLNGVKFMSKVDFCDGFWAILIREEDREQTGFVTRSGHWQWKVSPQGYASSPGIFQRAVNDTLGDMMWKTAMPYIDDVIVFSKTFKEHLKHLEELFQRLEKANFFLKLRKCEFLMESMEYLGHNISIQGMSPSKEKIQAILNLPIPNNPRSVKRVLGLGSYYRKYIKDFAARTHAMRELTKKTVKFNWTAECQKEFDDMKIALTSEPIMAYPDWSKEFIVTTDASKKGLGAILSQKYDDAERVIEYASRGLQGGEPNYGISELECSAVMWAVDKFAMYIRNSKFRLITDHRALQSIKNIKSNNLRLLRWSLKLADMNYDVEYKPGKLLTNADPLSREIAALIREASKRASGLRDLVKQSGSIELDLDDNSVWTVFQKGKDIWLLDQNDNLHHKLEWWSQPRKVITDTEEIRVILSSIHDNGHLGFKKCYARLQKSYFWWGMHQDCKLYCKSCEVCLCRLPARRNVGGKLGRLVATRRNELIGIDLFSGLPKSGQFGAILVITDYVSKYTMAIPLVNKKPMSVANAIYEKWITIFGFPEKIQSDKGKEFTAKLVKAFYKVFQIKKLQTSGWHPQANGQVERFNRTMADMLAKTCAEDQVNWSNYLSTVTMEYNAMRHRVTGESPHFLMFGKEFRMPIDIIHNVNLEAPREWTDSKFPTLVKKLKEVQKKIDKVHMDNALVYNRKRIFHNFKVGDKVMEVTMPQTKKDQGIHKKLVLPGMGPYTIVSISPDNNTVKLVDPEDPKEQTWVVNVSRVRAVVDRPDWMKDPQQRSVSEITGPVEIEVENMEISDEENDDTDYVGTSQRNANSEDESRKDLAIQPTKSKSKPRLVKMTEVAEHSVPKTFKALGTDMEARCISKHDLVEDLAVDVLVNNTWKCGHIVNVRSKGGLEVKVTGRHINAWTRVCRMRKCICDEDIPKPATLDELDLVKKKMYWKTE